MILFKTKNSTNVKHRTKALPLQPFKQYITQGDNYKSVIPHVESKLVIKTWGDIFEINIKFL